MLRWMNRGGTVARCGLVLLYLILAVSFAIITPPFEAPDETGHLFYINHVARTGSLPVQIDPERRVVGEGHQFPLYYVIGAIPVRLFLADNSVDLLPVKNRRYEAADAKGRDFPRFLHRDVEFFASDSDRAMFYLLRGCSIALGALTVWLTWAIAGMVRADSRFQFLATLLVATLPQFLFISASINNDNLVTLAATAAIYAALRFWQQPGLWNAVAVGAALGIALLTKKSALFLVPAIVVMLCAMWIVRRPNRDAVVRFGLAAIALAALLSAPIFIRNQVVYGDVLGAEMERQTLPELVDEKSLWDVYWMETFIPRMAESFVGVFGWMNVWLPLTVYLLYLLLGFLAVVGAIGSVRDSEVEERWKLGFLLSLCVLCLAGVIYYNLTYTQYQGRFLFPVIAPIAVLSAFGLWHWRQVIQVMQGVQSASALSVALVAALIVVDVVSLVVQWRFHYRAEQYLALIDWVAL